jgi:predicted DNA-binding ArsR family transcriptional regulator
MQVEIFKNHLPAESYTPTQETIIYHHRAYTVYKLNQPFNLAQKTASIIKIITSLFQNQNRFQFLKNSWQSKKFIFVYSKKFLMVTVKFHSLALHYAHSDLKEDKEIALAAIEQNDLAFDYVHENLKQDKSFISQAFERNNSVLRYIPEELKKDKDFILKFIKKDAASFQYAHESLKKDRGLVLEAVKRNGRALQFISEELKKDKDIVLEAVKQNTRALLYAHQDLKDDKEFILSVIKENGSAFHYISETLKKDRNFIFEVSKFYAPAFQFIADKLGTFFILGLIQKNYLISQYLPEDLKQDREFVLKAVQENYLILQYCHMDLRKDRSFALETIKINSCALQFVHEDLKKDRELVLEAIKHHGGALQYAHPDLKNDEEIVLQAVEKNGYVVQYAHDNLRKNEDFILQIAKKYNYALQFAHEDLRKSKAFALKAVKQNGLYLEHLESNFKQDKKVVLEAITQHARALHYADERVKQDRDFILRVVKLNSNVLHFTTENLRRDREIVLEATKHHEASFHSAHDDLKEDRTFVLQAIRQNGLVLQFVDEKFTSDKEIVLEAIRQNFHAFQHASPFITKDREFVLEAVKENGLILRYVKLQDSAIIEAAHCLLNEQLQSWLVNPEKKNILFYYAFFIVTHQAAFYLHDEHPLLQKAIEAYCITSSGEDPKNPYMIYAGLQDVIGEDTLIEDFEGFRKRASKKKYTFADIPDHIVPLQELFASIEQRGVDEKEVEELCCGASLQDVKENMLGEGKLIATILMQQGKKDDPLTVTAMYLYLILKSISDADDTRDKNCLSARENQLLKFASMIKECSTGQKDAIEQYYINTIGMDAISSSQNKIEETIDQSIQIALKKALASDDLLTDLIGKTPKQQSHQTLFLQNRYHRQIGLIHSLTFDRHTGVIDDDLIQKDPNEAIEKIKQYLHIQEITKQVLDQALKSSQGLRITYAEFIAYFEKEFNLSNYEQYIEFDEEMNPIGITPFAVEKMLKKLEYIK